jgi:hypothetical protein
MNRMAMAEELACMSVEEDDDTDIMDISNEFNYFTPSKCFYILMGDYTDGKKLLGRLQ